MTWAFIILLAFSPIDVCKDADRDTCTQACPGYAWCMICDKCVHVETAVTPTKDEL